MKMLVVEDEPLLAMLLEENLSELGHEIAGVAATVEQATALLDAGPVDFALLDFSLGSETNSTPVALRLREEGVPFIYLSGHRTLSEEGDIPPAPLLTKPFSLDQLDNAIRELKLAA
jgi:DNA-binding response OmpR family regulator